MKWAWTVQMEFRTSHMFLRLAADRRASRWFDQLTIRLCVTTLSLLWVSMLIGLAESNHQARPNYHELQWHGRWNKNGNTQNKQTNAQPWNKNHLAASDRNFFLNPTFILMTNRGIIASRMKIHALVMNFLMFTLSSMKFCTSTVTTVLLNFQTEI